MSRRIAARARPTTKRRALAATLFAYAIAGLLALWASPAHPQIQGVLQFDLAIAGRAVSTPMAMVGSVPVIRVRQGQTMALNWWTDEATLIHLDGYGVDVGVVPGASVIMKFKATVAGRYAVEAQGFGGRDAVAARPRQNTGDELAALADRLLNDIAPRRPRRPPPDTLVRIEPTGAQVILLYIDVLPR